VLLFVLKEIGYFDLIC